MTKTTKKSVSDQKEKRTKQIKKDLSRKQTATNGKLSLKKEETKQASK